MSVTRGEGWEKWRGVIHGEHLLGLSEISHGKAYHDALQELAAKAKTDIGDPLWPIDECWSEVFIVPLGSGGSGGGCDAESYTVGAKIIRSNLSGPPKRSDVAWTQKFDELVWGV